MTIRRLIRLPKQWPQRVKSGILHTISLAIVAEIKKRLGEE